MPRTSPPLHQAYAIVICVFALLVPSGIEAQSATADVGGLIIPDNNNFSSSGGTQSCTGFRVSSCSLASPDGAVQLNAAAGASVGGPLRTMASVEAAAWAPNSLASAHSVALAWFDDVFTLSNVPPDGTAQFNLFVTGYAEQIGDATTRAGSSLVLTLFYNTQNLGFLTSPGAHHFIPPPVPDPNPAYRQSWFNTNVNGMYSGLYSVTVSASSGTVPIRLFMVAQADLSGAYAGATLTGSASVDFYNTAVLQSIQFFDASGLDISGDVGFSAASGAQYQIGAPAATVPEPASMTLLATGLLAMAAARRRNRSQQS